MKRFALLRRARSLRVMLGVALAGLVPTLGVALTCAIGMIPIVIATVLENAMGVRSDAMAWAAIALAVAGWLGSAVFVALGTMRGFGWIARLRPRLGAASIGSDGISARDGLFEQRFIPWSAIEAVSIVRDGSLPAISLRLSDGSEQRLAVEDLDAFEDAAARAVEAHRAREPGPRLAELEPTADATTWIANVRDLARDDRGYRDGSRHPELLVRVAEDPTAPPAHRVGAALALSTAPAPIKARVRVAAEETVQEEVADAMLDALAGKVRKRALERIARRGG